MKIESFLQGAVYAWVRDRAGERFAARDLVGGNNRDWRGTPLQALYRKHRNAGKNDKDAAKAAGRDLGWLLKKVLRDDNRIFDVHRADVAEYSWTGKP